MSEIHWIEGVEVGQPWEREARGSAAVAVAVAELRHMNVID
jgi:hypothetical protein